MNYSDKNNKSKITGKNSTNKFGKSLNANFTKNGRFAENKDKAIGGLRSYFSALANERHQTASEDSKQTLDLINAKPKKSKIREKTLAKEEPTEKVNKISKLEELATKFKAKEKNTAKEKKQESEADDAERDKKTIHLKSPIMIRELAQEMDIKPHIIIKDLMGMDIFASINQSIDSDIAKRVCQKHGFVFQKEKREKGKGIHKKKKTKAPKANTTESKENLTARGPIITFMGHVDHGKTSLLDYIRKTKVIAKEAGGITQHIGAYQVIHKDHPITFLDTPGHAAFTEMRARGANITDIVVVVVAADDGIMPQTKEAINHAKDAGVAIIVAINKCDLPSADPERVKVQFQEIGLVPEEWGGDTIFCKVSAISGEGIDELLEMMTLQAEVLELKANPKGTTQALVIESKVETGKGPTATVIIENGTLHIGDNFICGNTIGKVKFMLNDTGERIKSAGPAVPVEVMGFDNLPDVGNQLVVVKNDKDAKKIREERLLKERMEMSQQSKKISLESLLDDITENEMKVLKVILKTDVQGSAEAIVDSLNQIESDKIKLEIIHSAAGNISESDVLFASASDAILLGFNTKVESVAAKTAKQEGVQVKSYKIIYELLDEVKDAMTGMLDKIVEEKILGKAEVKQVFKISKGKVAGCRVTEGRIKANSQAKLLRGKEEIYVGKISDLKHFQDSANEVKNGQECGIRIDTYSNYAEGDTIVAFETLTKEQTL